MHLHAMSAGSGGYVGELLAGGDALHRADVGAVSDELQVVGLARQLHPLITAGRLGRTG